MAGNLKPKLKWFLKPKVKLKLCYLIARRMFTSQMSVSKSESTACGGGGGQLPSADGEINRSSCLLKLRFHSHFSPQMYRFVFHTIVFIRDTVKLPVKLYCLFPQNLAYGQYKLFLISCHLQNILCVIPYLSSKRNEESSCSAPPII